MMITTAGQTSCHELFHRGSLSIKEPIVREDEMSDMLWVTAGLVTNALAHGAR
jgi:hypothetical protein